MDNIIQNIKNLKIDDNKINNKIANKSLQESKPNPNNNFYGYKCSSYNDLEIESLMKGVVSNDSRYKPSIEGELLYAWLGCYNNSFHIITTYGGFVEVKLFLYEDSSIKYNYLDFRQTIKGILELSVYYDIDGINLFGNNNFVEEETKRLIQINEHAVRNLKYCTEDIINLERKKFNKLENSYNKLENSYNKLENSYNELENSYNELENLYNELLLKYENDIIKKNNPEKYNIVELKYEPDIILTRKKKKEIELINVNIKKFNSIINLLSNTIKDINNMDINNVIDNINNSLNEVINIIYNN